MEILLQIRPDMGGFASFTEEKNVEIEIIKMYKKVITDW